MLSGGSARTWMTRPGLGRHPLRWSSSPPGSPSTAA
jgi:hypothetical protein